MAKPETSRQKFLDTLDSSDGLDASSGIEIGYDGESKAITEVIAAFDLEGDTTRRDLYESMRRVVLEAKRASRLTRECLLKLGVVQIRA
jgi:hypothetical protein